MIHLAADENLNNNIIRGLLRRNPKIDVVRIQDVGLAGADDATVLEWAAKTSRILLTQDVTTLTKTANERVKRGLVMPGVFEISRAVSLNRAIEDILLIAECSFEGEWEGQIHYLPL